MLKSLLFILIGILVLSGCRNNSLKVPISKIDLDISIQRFEKDLFELNPSNIPDEITKLEDKYGEFLSLFGYVTNIGEPGDSTFPELLSSFATDRLNNEVLKATQESYPDLTSLEKELTTSFKYYLYYYPERKVPNIYTFISGFNSSIIIDNNILAIGLDRYLGSECKYYPQLGISNYQSRNMIPEKIPYDCMYAWASTEFNFEGAKKNDVADNVLNNILFEAKLFYFVNAMIPDANEAMIFGFTDEQLGWCKENESHMWTYLVENQLLYNTERCTIRKLIGDAPFTSFFPKESPGKAAVWLGFQIIKHYLSEKSDATLQELMNDADYQEILRVSKYDPR